MVALLFVMLCLLAIVASFQLISRRHDPLTAKIKALVLVAVLANIFLPIGVHTSVGPLGNKRLFEEWVANQWNPAWDLLPGIATNGTPRVEGLPSLNAASRRSP
jgi:hypothetical protein